jgi:hypothetical protein
MPKASKKGINTRGFRRIMEVMFEIPRKSAEVVSRSGIVNSLFKYR